MVGVGVVVARLAVVRGLAASSSGCRGICCRGKAGARTHHIVAPSSAPCKLSEPPPVCTPPYGGGGAPKLGLCGPVAPVWPAATALLVLAAFVWWAVVGCRPPSHSLWTSARTFRTCSTPPVGQVRACHLLEWYLGDRLEDGDHLLVGHSCHWCHGRGLRG